MAFSAPMGHSFVKFIDHNVLFNCNHVGSPVTMYYLSEFHNVQGANDGVSPYLPLVCLWFNSTNCVYGSTPPVGVYDLTPLTFV